MNLSDAEVYKPGQHQRHQVMQRAGFLMTLVGLGGMFNTPYSNVLFPFFFIGMALMSLPVVLGLLAWNKAFEKAQREKRLWKLTLPEGSTNAVTILNRCKAFNSMPVHVLVEEGLLTITMLCREKDLNENLSAIDEDIAYEEVCRD